MPPGAGPIRTQAADVVELLSDPARCQVALVTLPEEMPVNEAVEAAYQLEDKVGIALGPVIVNGCYPPMAGLAMPAAAGGRGGRGRASTTGLVAALDAGPPVPAHPPGAPGGAARPAGPRAAPPPAAGALPLHRLDRPDRSSRR